MEMSSLHPEETTEPAEPGPSRQRPSYRDDQVWKDIEAETGFASCADYMEFYKDIRPDFNEGLRHFRSLGADETTEIGITIHVYDLSKQTDSGKCLTFRQDCHSGTELIRTLRDPPGDVCLQLVLWPIDSRSSFNQELADAMILGLRLDPNLLQDVDSFFHLQGQDRYRTDGFRTSPLRTLIGPGTVTTLSRNFKSKSASAVPVLLVASDHITFRVQDPLLAETLTRAGRGKPPFSRPTSVDRQRPALHPYVKAVEEYIAQSRFAISTEPVLRLAAVSPLLHIEANRVHKLYIDVKETYDELMQRKFDHRPTHPHLQSRDVAGELDMKRLALRYTIEKGEDNLRQTFRYLGSDIDVDWPKEPLYKSFKAEWNTLIDDARCLETEVRDDMQIQVGNLSLEESRRSIELSNIQIHESQSVKIFTILAFVYVPLNLATSIFGMNIQQLNQNGQNIWVFLVTAVVALLVTGSSWFLSNAVYQAISWYKKLTTRSVESEVKDQNRKYDFPYRIAMLIWLVRRGETAWMLKTGAGLAIFINSKILSRGPAYIVQGRLVAMTACDFVWIVSNSIHGDRMKFDDFIRWFPISDFLKELFESIGPRRHRSEEPMRVFPRARRHSSSSAENPGMRNWPPENWPPEGLPVFAYRA